MASLQKRDEQSLLPQGVSLAEVTQFLDRTPTHESESIKHRRAIMEILLDSVCPVLHQPKGAYAKLWMEEATYRAVNILQLLLYNHSVSEPHSSNSDNSEQYKKANQLAVQFVELRRKSDHHSLYVSAVLTNVISAIFKVFAHAKHPMRLHMSIKDFRLSACKLHALVLICTEFAFSALKLGFQQQSSGQFRIMLDCVEEKDILVIIEIETMNAQQALSASGYRLVSRLASVLNAEVVNRITKSGAARFELLFPLST